MRPNHYSSHMKFKNILFALAIPSLAILASCGDDGTTEKPKPTLTFQTGSGYTFSNAVASLDSALKIGIRASSTDQKLKQVEVRLSTNGGTAGVIWDTVLNTKIFNFDYIYRVAGSVGNTLTLSVVAIDDNGEKTTQSLNIDIAPANIPLGRQQGQIVYNIQSPTGFNGAYDLVTSSPRFSADAPATKDIVDQTPSSAVFNKTWGTLNGSKFVKVTSSDYDNATTSTFIYNLWKSNSASAKSSISGIALGDVYVIQSGQTGGGIKFNLFILKVTEVKETTTDNLDFIKFEYKGDI